MPIICVYNEPKNRQGVWSRLKNQSTLVWTIYLPNNHLILKTYLPIYYKMSSQGETIYYFNSKFGKNN
jgi:hypothetical protein